MRLLFYSGKPYRSPCQAKCDGGVKVQCKGKCPCENTVCTCSKIYQPVKKLYVYAYRIIDKVCGTDGKDNLIRIESFHLYVQVMSMTTNVWQNVKELKFSARENVLVRNHVKLLGISDQCVELTVSSGVFDKHHF